MIVGAASCTLGLKEDIAAQLDQEQAEQYQSLKVIGSTTGCRDLQPHLAICRTLRRVAVRPTGSTTHLGPAGALGQIAGRLADEIEVPAGTTSTASRSTEVARAVTAFSSRANRMTRPDPRRLDARLTRTRLSPAITSAVHHS